MPESSTTWWRAPELARVWAAVGARLEQTGLSPTGRVTVGELSRAEQRAISDLLGRGVLGERVRIDLPLLDERLRSRAGIGLADAASHNLGRVLVDRGAARARQSARRAAPLALAGDWADEHTELPRSTIDEWAAGLARDGILTRDADPSALVGDALSVIEERVGWLVGEIDEPPVARTELAARMFGDAHALDEYRRLAAVILRLVSMLTGEPAGRTLWERIGVITDRVSTTCLTLGLMGVAEPVDTASRPVHLMWRDLDSGLSFARGQDVLVCENPRVLEAAAEVGIPGRGFVCTSGRPALVTVEVLDRLRAAGARLRYHGDFDWPGVAMANDLVSRIGAEPWRMSAADYVDLPARLPLAGARVDAMWDPELAPAMAHRGLAVHEEATLPELLHGL